MTEDLKQHLKYDPETGVFIWIKKPSQPIKLYSVAGNTCPKTGYVRIRFKNKAYMAHDLAMYLKGYDKKDLVIDHINGIRNDNRLCNLRDVSYTDNAQNISLPSHNTSGHIGVSWLKTHKSWTVYIKVDKKNKWLGYYKDLEKAVVARKAGEAKYYNLPEAENY